MFNKYAKHYTSAFFLEISDKINEKKYDTMAHSDALNFDTIASKIRNTFLNMYICVK